MTNDLIERLKTIAQAATGGDWRAHITTKRSPEIYTNIPPPNTPNPLIAGTILRKRDAEFIAAANPSVVLELIQALQLSQQRNARLMEVLGLIASCEKRADGDIVDLARKTIWETQ